MPRAMLGIDEVLYPSDRDFSRLMNRLSKELNPCAILLLNAIGQYQSKLRVAIDH